MLSEANPYFFRGKAGEGVGGPHEGLQHDLAHVHHVSRADDDRRTGDPAVPALVCAIRRRARGSCTSRFDKDDAANFTRPWFAWANTLFGELVVKLAAERPGCWRPAWVESAVRASDGCESNRN